MGGTLGAEYLVTNLLWTTSQCKDGRYLISSLAGKAHLQAQMLEAEG